MSNDPALTSIEAETTYSADDRPLAQVLDTVAELSAQTLPTLPDGYVHSRVAIMDRPLCCLARRRDAIVGFKLAYATSGSVLFSWLGGVLPSARRSGVGRGLMLLQHAEARTRGFSCMETHTRSANRAMLLLNLQSGYEVVGCEADAHGRFIVKQRINF